MTFLRNPHLDLTTIRIETARCVLVPFSTDGRVDIHELQEEFCRTNTNRDVSQFLPTFEEEMKFVEESIEAMKQGELLELFVLHRETGKLLGAIGLRDPEAHRINLGFWLRTDEQRKGYGTEIYGALLDWARENTIYSYLKHSLVPENIASRKLALKFGGILQDEVTEHGNVVYHIPLS